MERRRYSRLVIPLEVEFHLKVSETGELLQGQGIVRDLSLSGSYFHVEDPPPLRPGQILSLIIAAPLPYLDLHDTSHLRAQGEVVRLDPPGAAGFPWGVAVHFLSHLTFSAP
jgi:hypothetical protein